MTAPRHMRLLPVLALSLYACAFAKRGVNAPLDDLYFPIGIVVPSGGHLAYISNANFDLRYNSGTLTTIDLDALPAYSNQTEVFNTEVIKSEWTKRIGNIASKPTLNAAGTQMYVATRERSLFFRFDIDPVTGEPTCGDERRPYDETVSCDVDHTTRITGELFGSDLHFADTADPYVSAVAPVSFGFARDFLFLTHLSAGALSAFDVTPNTVNNPNGFRPLSLLGVDTLGAAVNGTSAIAVASGPGRKTLVYVGTSSTQTTTTRLSSAMFYFEPRVATGEPGIRGVIPLYNFLGGTVSSTDIKDIVISPDGQRLYMVTRGPDAIVELDISLDVEGNPRNTFIRAMPVAKQPGALVYIPASQTGGRDVIYVSCFLDNTLRAYEADTLAPLSKIDNIESGPFALAVARRPDNGTWLLASYFSDDAVLVIDATDADTSTHRVINRIGKFRRNKK